MEKLRFIKPGIYIQRSKINSEYMDDVLCTFQTGFLNSLGILNSYYCNGHISKRQYMLGLNDMKMQLFSKLIIDK